MHRPRGRAGNDGLIHRRAQSHWVVYSVPLFAKFGELTSVIAGVMLPSRCGVTNGRDLEM